MPKINVSISLYRHSLVVGNLAVAAVGTLYVAIQLMEGEVGSAIASFLVLNALRCLYLRYSGRYMGYQSV
jgi:hypothetical protein